MKMRVRKKINWMKRMVAAGMAVCMVLTTPASALAGAGEGTGTQTYRKKQRANPFWIPGQALWMQGKMAEPEDRRKVQSRAGQNLDRQRGTIRKGRRDRRDRVCRKRQRDRRDRICGTRQRDRKNRISRKGNTAGQHRFRREQQPDRRHSSVRKCRAETRVHVCRKRRPEPAGRQRCGKPGRCRIRSGGCGKSDSDADT